MGWVTAMVLTFTLMVASIFFGLFVAALILSAIETAQQCAEEWLDLNLKRNSPVYGDFSCVGSVED
jgi:hypothetical protein